jgi:(p)ppGpp synthase/HD superfamily hydrolase
VTLMAAVLHDTIEDTKTTAEELDAQFGRTGPTKIG